MCRTVGVVGSEWLYGSDGELDGCWLLRRGGGGGRVESDVSDGGRDSFELHVSDGGAGSLEVVVLSVGNVSFASTDPS